MQNEDLENDQSRPYIPEESEAINSSIFHHHNINPDCGVCSRPVFWSRHILALDRVWHIQCFICSHCYKSLKPGEQTLHSGRLYCTNPCFINLFSGECTSHKNSENNQRLKTDKVLQKEKLDQIDEKKIGQHTNEDEEQANLACLHCVKCKRSITSQHHYHHHNLENYPYCKFLGYEANFDSTVPNNKRKDQIKDEKRRNRLMQSRDPGEFIGQKCTKCNKIIYATEISYSINLPYHQKCLKCSICDRILQPAAHTVHDGLPICTFPCYNRIYLLNSYRKGFHECRP